MTTVKKAVIPAAGLGTRFLPATKSMPKEMLPLIDRPTIQYVVEEAVNSGIEDIIIITGRSKRAIEDYFDDSPELEMHLEMNGKTDELSLIREISDIADIHYIRQKEPRGLGDAVLRAEKHIGDDPFAVLLGDDIVINSHPCTGQLIDVYEKTGSPVIAIEEVPEEKVSSYGIVDVEYVDDCLYKILDIVEKPPLSEAPSRLGAIGRYVFTPQLFDCLKRTERGVGGEIQLTDAIRMLNGIQDVYAFSFSGKRYDTGDKLGYLKAIFDFAMNDPEMSESICEYMSDALRESKKPRF